MHLRSAIGEQGPMTPTVMSWVWQVDFRGSELDTRDNLCLQEIKLRADLTSTSAIYTGSAETTRMFRLTVDGNDIRWNGTELNRSL